MSVVQRIRVKKDVLLRAFVEPLAQAGITPNALSGIGLVLGVSAGMIIFVHPLLMLILGLAGKFFDLLDGAVARLTKKQGTWWVDPVCDRIVSAAFLATNAFITHDTIAIIGLLAFLLVCAINFSRKTSYSLIFPEPIIILMYFFGLAWWAALVMLVISLTYLFFFATSASRKILENIVGTCQK